MNKLNIKLISHLLNASPGDSLAVDKLISLSIHLLFLAIHLDLFNDYVGIHSIFWHVRVFLNVEFTVYRLVIVLLLLLLSSVYLIAHYSLLLLASRSRLTLLTTWSILLL